MSSSSSSSFEIVGQTFSALALGVPFLSCRSASSFALSSLFPSIQVRRGVLLVVSPCRRRRHRRRATRTKTKTTTEKKKESLSRARRDAPRPRAPRRPLHDVSSSESSHLVVGGGFVGVTASLPFSKHHNNSHKTNERACRRRLWKVVLLFFSLFFFFFFVVFVVVVSLVGTSSGSRVHETPSPFFLFFCSFPKP